MDDAARAKRRTLHVVVVDEELPYPLNSGKRIRTLNLLLPLARRHRITYLCHPTADADETRQARKFLESHGIETVLVERRLPGKSGPMFYARLLWNLASRLPYSVQSHNSAPLRRVIRRYAAANQVDLWHCEWTPYAESLVRVAGARPWVVTAHNVESLIWRRYFETEPNRLKRSYIHRQWRKFERFERRIFSIAPRTIAVSQCDARLMRDEFGAARVAVVDNGVDVGYFQPTGAIRDPYEILFLGSLDWRPNLDGVELLLGEVLPRVAAIEPSVRLTLVGRKPPAWLRERVGALRNVALHADVPDVRPFLARCGLMIVPLRVGGGSRLKILESLAAQCPVISTRVGAEGLHIEPGKHYVSADTPEAMAEAVVEYARRPGPIRSMAHEGRTAVVERYDWVALSSKLEAVWLDQAQSQGSRS